MKKAKKTLIFAGLLVSIFILNPSEAKATTCSMDSTGGNYSVTESCTFGYDTTTKTISDKTTNGNRGIATGTTVVQGQYGSARSFDGSSDWVDLPAVIDGQSAATLTAWIKPDGWTGKDIIVAEGGTTHGYFLESDDTGTYLEMRIYASGETYATQYALSNFSAGTWYHIAGVFSGGNYLRIYVDGEQVSENTTGIPASVPNPGNEASIGSAAGGGNKFDGTIDDVRMYGYARSEDQAEEDMQNHPSPTGDGPIGHWPMDDGYVNGIDNGDLTITSGNTLTINAGQTIVWNPGKSITIEDGATIAINTTGSLEQTYLWVSDPDGDGWYVDDTLVASDTQPTDYVRRYTTIGSAMGDGGDGSVTINSSTNLNTTAVAAGRSNADAISYEVTALGSNTATGQPQTPDTEAWLKMDESSGDTATDSSGNGHNGTDGPKNMFWKLDETANDSCSGGEDACDSSGNAVHGTATGTTIVNGVYGKARYFNGSSDYIVANDRDLFNDMNQFTIEMWVYHQSTTKDHDMIVKGAHTSDEPLVFWRDEASTDHYALLITDDQGHYSDILYSAYVPQLQTATHVAITFVANDKVRMYFDGVEDSNSPFTISDIGGVKETTDDIYIGNHAGGSDKYFHGIIDDLRIYNYARTQSEIQSDKNNGSGPSGRGPSIVSGKYGNARSFNGKGDHIALGNNAFGAVGNFTVEAWVKTSASTNQIILSEYELTVCGDAVFALSSSGLVTFHDGATTTNTGDTAVNDGTWHHVAYTYDGSNGMTYVDGDPGTDTTGASWRNVCTGQDVLIGKREDGTAFNGQIDDLRFYTYARTQTEINADLADPSSLVGITSGDHVLIINLEGSDTYNTNVGKYELLKVQSVTDNTATFSSNIQNIFGATDSNSDLTDQKIILQRVPQYSDVTINNTTTASNWGGTSGGVVAIKASDTLTVNSGQAIQMNGTNGGNGGSAGDGPGARGGGGEYGGLGAYGWETTTGEVGYGFGGGGGGILCVDGGDVAGGGGGGSFRTQGTVGENTYCTPVAAAGSTYGTDDLAKLYRGSGGGGGGSDGDSYLETGGGGGGGGGIILLFAKTLDVDGSITTNGGNGGNHINETDGEAGAGGGGSGGSIKLYAKDIDIAGSLSSVGGTGGTSQENGTAGGDGGKGGVAAYYLYTLSQSGSSDPSAYTEQVSVGPTKVYLAQGNKRERNHDLLSSLVTSLQNLQQH